MNACGVWESERKDIFESVNCLTNSSLPLLSFLFSLPLLSFLSSLSSPSLPLLFLSLIGQVTVVVVDVNDNTPVFPERQVNISVSEGEDITINPQLLTVTATDADDSLNGDILYGLIGDEGIP